MRSFNLHFRSLILSVLHRLNAVKVHKASLVTKERDIAAREAAAAEREGAIASMMAAKDEEIASLRSLAASAETMLHARIREAIARRDEELRAMVECGQIGKRRRVRRWSTLLKSGWSG